MNDNEETLDYGLVEPIALPPDSRVPGVPSGPDEYDSYFRIRRQSLSLLAWSRTFLDLQERVLADVAHAELSAEERYEMVQGFLVMHSVTLEKWVSTIDALSESQPPGAEGGQST